MDNEIAQTGSAAPSGGSVGDAPRPDAGRFEWLQAASYCGGWQYGEQGVIEEIFDIIGTDTRYCIEFGAGDGGHLPLTVGRLIDAGWKSLLIESDAQSCEYLTERCGTNATIVNKKVGLEGDDRLEKIMESVHAPWNPDLVVIDVDSTDFHIWKSLPDSIRPRVVMIEHMDLVWGGSEATTDEPVAVDKSGEKLGAEGFVLQTSAVCIELMAQEKGYVPVYRNRVNTIYVVKEEAEKLARPMVRLNLGCGAVRLEGYVNLDIKDGTDVRKLPYKDGTVDEVYASHLLEHFDYDNEVPDVLKEWVRVLRPGGILRLSVPDVDKYCKERSTLNSFMLDRVFLGGHKDENDRHGSVFDETKLRQAMGTAGIGGIEKFEPFAPDCSRHPISLNLDGRKRYFRKLVSPRICMVLSQPRFAFTGHEECLIKLSQKLKFNVVFSKGAFWDRDITISTQCAISQYNPDIILYSDYDSIFDENDAIKLIDSLNSDPYAAVKGVVQMERTGMKTLVFDQKADYSGPQTKVRFQHFGLTVVRREVFEEIPLPWFWSVPGANGDWMAWNRSDADITFWRMLTEYGFNVYQHNDIVIGHIINAVKWPKIDGSGILLQPEDAYRTHGKPPKAGFNAELYRDKAKAPATAPSDEGKVRVSG